MFRTATTGANVLLNIAELGARWFYRCHDTPLQIGLCHIIFRERQAVGGVSLGGPRESLQSLSSQNVRHVGLATIPMRGGRLNITICRRRARISILRAVSLASRAPTLDDWLVGVLQSRSALESVLSQGKSPDAMPRFQFSRVGGDYDLILVTAPYNRLTVGCPASIPLLYPSN